MASSKYSLSSLVLWSFQYLCMGDHGESTAVSVWHGCWIQHLIFELKSFQNQIAPWNAAPLPGFWEYADELSTLGILIADRAQLPSPWINFGSIYYNKLFECLTVYLTEFTPPSTLSSRPSIRRTRTTRITCPPSLSKIPSIWGKYPAVTIWAAAFSLNTLDKAHRCSRAACPTPISTKECVR